MKSTVAAAESPETPSSGRGVLCVHLYDDFSGAAKVCAQAATALADAGHRVTVLVGSAGATGFIRSAFPQARRTWYRFSSRPALRLVYFGLAQLALFVGVLRACAASRPATVYVSTLHPAAAVLAARACGCRVVCHVHEVRAGSRWLFRALRWVADTLATDIVCVSRYAAESLRFRRPERVRVVPNTLSVHEWTTADRIARSRGSVPGVPFRVLMVCSLKWYKGLDTFFELAKRAGQRGLASRFTLVVNADEPEFERFAAAHAAANLRLVRRPASVYDHYAEADLVLNLSHPEGWIETFGLTLLEAMACGVPVVCPPVGGCVELFEDGAGGWRISSRDVEGLLALVGRLQASPRAWLAASREARRAAEAFGFGAFHEALCALVRSDPAPLPARPAS